MRVFKQRFESRWLDCPIRRSPGVASDEPEAERAALEMMSGRENLTNEALASTYDDWSLPFAILRPLRSQRAITWHC
jgi:hypothetical protein